MSAELENSQGTRERELFLSALEKPDPAERAAFLDAVCGSDRALRLRVEELLGEHSEVGAFLETPALANARPLPRGAEEGPTGTALINLVVEKPGDQIGRYKLLQKIGEGGCGVVYMAEQEQPVRRRVALKVIKLGMDTRSVIARFEAERQALAMMDHPNIAKVLDAGATENGRPFFVMELVRGIKITEYCDHNQLSTEERLKLFIQVCHAIQHAHQKGIIHRDIKPSNLLVTLHDGRPVPKVIDFGIAKATEQRLTDKTLFTEFAAFIGTPAYMSPEQAEMSGLDIDTRSDIYSLGVLLYELLTGKTPFDAEGLLRAGLDECRRTIREQEPVRPSTRLATMIEADLSTAARQRHTESVKLVHSLRGDLDWIVMTCLEKDRARRYETANALALEINRYLDSEPVLARPPSNVYRFRKLLRRHRAAFAAGVGIAATLLMGAGISAWQAVRATRAEHRAHVAQQLESQLRQQAEQEWGRAELEEGRARLNEYVADINLAKQSLDAGNYGRAMQLLRKHWPRAGEPDLRGFEWRYLWQLGQGDDHISFPGQDGPVHSLAISPDGQWLALGLSQKVNVWNVRNRSLAVTIPKGAVSMAFLPDGKMLATASGGTVRLWRTSDWSEAKSLRDNSGPMALSSDGALLAASTRQGVRVWNTSTWSEPRLLRGTFAPVAFSPDGHMLATDSKAGITLWPLDGVRSELVLQDSTNLLARFGPWSRPDRVMAFSPDGRVLVAARNTLSTRGVFILSIWDTGSGEEIAVIPKDPEHIEHTGAISSLSFSPDGRTLATASLDYSIRLWDVGNRQRISTLQGHSTEVLTLAFTPDGESLISGAKDGGVKLWPTRAREKDEIIPGGWEPLAFSKDSKILAARTREGTVAFLNLATREPEQELPLDSGRSHFPSPISVSTDLAILAQGLHDGRVKLWDTRTLESTTLKVSDGPVETAALSPDGHVLLTAGFEQPLRWWDLRAGTNINLQTEAHRVLFSPDGRAFATFQKGNTVQIWDAVGRTVRTNLLQEPQPALFPGGFGPEPLFFSAAAFSADGRVLAITSIENTIRLWDTTSGQLIGTCTGHKQAVFSVAFSPDGNTLASASDDSTLKLWNVANQQELLTVRRLGGTLRGLMFSPDGSLLAGASGLSSRSRGLRLYRAPRLSEIDRIDGQANHKIEGD